MKDKYKLFLSQDYVDFIGNGNVIKLCEEWEAELVIEKYIPNLSIQKDSDGYG